MLYKNVFNYLSLFSLMLLCANSSTLLAMEQDDNTSGLTTKRKREEDGNLLRGLSQVQKTKLDSNSKGTGVYTSLKISYVPLFNWYEPIEQIEIGKLEKFSDFENNNLYISQSSEQREHDIENLSKVAIRVTTSSGKKIEFTTEVDQILYFNMLYDTHYFLEDKKETILNLISSEFPLKVSYEIKNAGLINTPPHIELPYHMISFADNDKEVMPTAHKYDAGWNIGYPLKGEQVAGSISSDDIKSPLSQNLVLFTVGYNMTPGIRLFSTFPNKDESDTERKE